MGAKLVAYENVPPGFEMVVDGEELVELVPGFSGGCWNLWFNVKLFDDPDAWDGEIEFLNEMQSRLGGLSSEQRLIRAQMAEFCRMHPLFPRSIDILCEEIGEECFIKPMKIGCEGRGLLDSLGYHDPQSLSEQWRELLAAYARSLEKWMGKSRPKNPTESKVFSFLGQPTNTKEAFVEKLVSVLNTGDPSISPLKKLSGNEYREIYGESISGTPGRPLNCFNCEEGCPEGASMPSCQCCYFMVMDAGLLSSRTYNEKRSIVDEFRRYVEENILAYAFAINSWLKGEAPQQVMYLVTARHVSKERARQILKTVYSSLGRRKEVKEWLAGCLLKTLKDNQRWHKRAELIDNFPGATSWFGEMLGGAKTS